MQRRDFLKGAAGLAVAGTMTFRTAHAGGVMTPEPRPQRSGYRQLHYQPTEVENVVRALLQRRAADGTWPAKYAFNYILVSGGVGPSKRTRGDVEVEQTITVGFKYLRQKVDLGREPAVARDPRITWTVRPPSAPWGTDYDVMTARAAAAAEAFYPKMLDELRVGVLLPTLKESPTGLWCVEHEFNHRNDAVGSTAVQVVATRMADAYLSIFETYSLI